MAYTQAQIDALKDALARGVRSVTYDGKQVDYQSREEMRKQLAEMEAEVRFGGKRRPGVRLAQPR